MDTLTLAERTVLVALAEEGQKEEGKANWGPRVKQYLKSANVTVPAAWCAGFVNWAAEKAAADFGMVSPLESVPNQAYVQSYVEHGKTHGWVVTDKTTAQRGDLICFWHEDLKRYAHIGIVTGWATEKTHVLTIEGNTNDEGSREGYEVAVRTRKLGITTMILRPF